MTVSPTPILRSHSAWSRSHTRPYNLLIHSLARSRSSTPPEHWPAYLVSPSGADSKLARRRCAWRARNQSPSESNRLNWWSVRSRSDRLAAKLKCRLRLETKVPTNNAASNLKRNLYTVGSIRCYCFTLYTVGIIVQWPDWLFTLSASYVAIV